MDKEEVPYPRSAAHANHVRWEKFCAYLGAGLGGLILFGDLAKDAFANADYTIRAMFITAAVAAGAAIGRAYWGFTHADYELSRAGYEGPDNQNLDTPGWVVKSETMSFFFYWVGAALLACATALLFVAAWTGP
ncbi:hypothetical protein G9E11_01940 [Arthrobacter sp. IA7]|uniref:hypothetical protein n=1 Tax=Arthrobacter ipis TaxID=2716202 RepID=UPI00168642BB|nr:hypothetical protein [Arthrobacter ipis]MBD1541035.1 hypothetical protein [Arthrobacter ipis]